MYRGIVYIDLDGTLFGEGVSISFENKIALQKLRQSGYLIVVVSGRHITQIDKILKDNYIDSYILSNGQFIVAEGKILSQNIIETKVIDDLYQFSKKHDVNICYYGNSLLAVEEEDELVEKTFNYFSIAEYEERASFFKNNEVIMLMLLTENKKLDEYFKKEFPELNFYRTSPYSIDAIPNTASKGHAIRQFEKHMGFENMDSYAFGDSPNDISMFQVSDYKISMSNASEELKNISDIVVDNSNDTGVANGLRYFQLI